MQSEFGLTGYPSLRLPQSLRSFQLAPLPRASKGFDKKILELIIHHTPEEVNCSGDDPMDLGCVLVRSPLAAEG